MTADFILDRLEVIAASAHERESGNETWSRMLGYLSSHKDGNEEAMKPALTKWLADGAGPKSVAAQYLLMKLRL